MTETPASHIGWYGADKHDKMGNKLMENCTNNEAGHASR